MSKNFISLLLLIVAVAVFWVWSKPYFGEIDLLRVEKKAIEESLANSRELQELRDGLLQKYNLISLENSSRLSKLLPTSAEITKLMVELENIAQATGVRIKRINAIGIQQPSQPTSKAGSVSFAFQEQAENLLLAGVPPYQSAIVNMVFSTSYEGFRAFLEELQRSLRLMNVDDISFSAAEANLYEFTIKAEIYFKK